jgi:hypothetical protein
MFDWMVLSFITFIFFIVGGMLIVLVDFLIVCIFGKSPLLAMEKFLFEKFGS